jgi:hypothetical protein
LAALRNLLICLSLSSFAQAIVGNPDVDTLISSMVSAYEAKHSRLQPYVILRNYEVFKSGERDQTSPPPSSTYHQPPKPLRFDTA